MTDIKRLRGIIERKGLKMSWVADKLGISKQSFSQKLNGKVEFSKAEIVKLKEILELTNRDVIEIFLPSNVK